MNICNGKQVDDRFTQGARQIAGGEGAPIGSCEGSDWEIETKSEKIKMARIEMILDKSENITNIFANDTKDNNHKRNWK